MNLKNPIQTVVLEVNNRILVSNPLNLEVENAMENINTREMIEIVVQVILLVENDEVDLIPIIEDFSPIIIDKDPY